MRGNQAGSPKWRCDLNDHVRRWHASCNERMLEACRNDEGFIRGVRPGPTIDLGKDGPLEDANAFFLKGMQMSKDIARSVR